MTEYDHPSMVIIALGNLLHHLKGCDNSSFEGTNDEACNVSVERFEAALDDFMKRLLQLFRMSLKHLFVIVSLYTITSFYPF